MTEPNILFCLADDAGMHMGAYGCDWVNTPGFDRVAREGVLFDRAFTPNAKCAPSRACILTGRNSWELEEAANHQAFFPAKFKTCFESLRENGYFVGYTGKGWSPGDPGTVNGRARELTGSNFSQRVQESPTPYINRNDYAGNFSDFLRNKPQDTPFCFWYGGFEPHRPYEYGSGVAKGGKKTSDIDSVYDIWPDNEAVRNDLLDYGYEIEHFDRHLCSMLQILEEKGELDNTLVVVTSDNGMPFPRIKGQEYYYSNRLPLAIMWGERLRNPGRVEKRFVSFIDFTPTFLEIAGIEQGSSGMQPVTGQSLTDILYDTEAEAGSNRDHVLVGKERHDVGRPADAGYPIRGVFKGPYLYLINFEPDRWPAGNPETGYTNSDGGPTKTEVLKTRKNPEKRWYWQLSFGKRVAEELYCIDDDPSCINNLAEEKDYAGLKQELHDLLMRELAEQGDPRMEGRGDIFDRYPVANSRNANYYERFLNGEIPPGRWINESDIEDDV